MIFKCIDDLPAITGFDDCNPDFHFGEVEEIIVGHLYKEEGEEAVSVYPTDPSSADDWGPLLDINGGEAIAYRIPVRGTLGEPDQTILEASKNRKAYPPADWTLECRIDDLPNEVYDALRQLRNKQVRLWFLAGGKIFGGATGIVPASVNSFYQIEEGTDSMHNFHMNLSWLSNEIPERHDAPVFEEEDADV